MEYKIVYGRDASDLERRVNELIALGWVPIGGIALQQCGEFFQTMSSTTQSREAAARARDY